MIASLFSATSQLAAAAVPVLWDVTCLGCRGVWYAGAAAHWYVWGASAQDDAHAAARAQHRADVRAVLLEVLHNPVYAPPRPLSPSRPRWRRASCPAAFSEADVGLECDSEE